jgi:hypothetical protein
MHEVDFEEKVEAFWSDCDAWVNNRQYEVLSSSAKLAESDFQEIAEFIEERISNLIAQGVQIHGESFSPELLCDTHHLFFELELKERGLNNGEYIHRYKENGLLGISVMEGQVEPDNAQLIMKINTAHTAKKKGREDEPCEDCICGKK